MYKFLKGFTLAEVLVTLGIVGIIAAITLPALIQRNNEKSTVVKLKKVYSVMSNAHMQAVNDYGNFDSWGLQKSQENGSEDEEAIATSDAGINRYIEIMSKYLKTVKICKASDNSCEVWDSYNLAGVKDNSDSYTTRMVLADGTVIGHIFINYPECDGYWGTGKLSYFCGSFKVDLNGSKKPNTYGKDIFEFDIIKSGVIPAGTFEAADTSFEGKCINYSHRMGGIGCTAWVIMNENMDYLHCTDLSWTGKTKCK